jgi:Fic family protein
MCDFANMKIPNFFIHPVIRSIILHFWLAYDHPFVDGNGRTARALFYWSMLRHGYWLCEYISISRVLRKAPARYARSFLFTETDDNDLTYFILEQLNVLDKAVDELHRYLRRKATQLQTLERELRGVLSLNYRQRSLVSHALRHPHQLYTFESHRTSHNISYQTSRTDLLDLHEKGLLLKSKRGKALVFEAVQDLEGRLSE